LIQDLDSEGNIDTKDASFFVEIRIFWSRNYFRDLIQDLSQKKNKLFSIILTMTGGEVLIFEEKTFYWDMKLLFLLET